MKIQGGGHGPSAAAHACKLGFHCVQNQRYAKKWYSQPAKMINMETLEEQKFVRLPPKLFGGFVHAREQK